MALPKILKEDGLKELIQLIRAEDAKKADIDYLETVAFTGSYNDLKDTPPAQTIDDELKDDSENAVENKAIYKEVAKEISALDVDSIWAAYDPHSS